MSAPSFAENEGLVAFYVDLRVSVKEMATWSPERITAFFDGIRKAMNAKNYTDGDRGLARTLPRSAHEVEVEYG